MTRLLRLLQSVAQGRATDKMLIKLSKSPAVALLQRYRRVGLPNFNLTAGSSFKLRGHLPWKTVQQRNSGRFPLTYQYVVCCTQLCNRAQLLQQAWRLGPRL
jgi:hypothetical protein